MHKLALILAFTMSFVASLSAQKLDRIALFDGEKSEFPESIAIDRSGNLYLTLTVARTVKKVTPATGQRSDFARIPDDFLLGIAADSADNLFVCGSKGIWKITPAGRVTLYSAVPGRLSLNDLVIARDGSLYVSDDEKFVIWKIDPRGRASIWSEDPLFVARESSFPIPVGVNGLALSHDQRTLFATNTSNGQLLAVPIGADGRAGAARILLQGPGLIGADGIRSDATNTLYIAQNIERKILRYTSSGGLQTLAGGGLLAFPTSLVLNRAVNPSVLFVCNNGDAFFSETPAGQGVLRLRLH